MQVVESDCSMFMDACSGLFRIGRRNWLKFELGVTVGGGANV